MNLNLKQLLKTVIPIAAIIIISPFLLLIAFLTSLIWVPLLILFATTYALLYYVIKKTPIGNQMRMFYTKDIKERIDSSGGLRIFLVETLNNILCLTFPKLQRKVNNYGYAVLNNDGRLISEVSAEFEDERFPLQLYHYLATSFERYKNLAKCTVLELECGMGGGLEYIAKHLKAKKCVGVTSSPEKAKFCQEKYKENEQLEIIEAEIETLSEDKQLKGQKFDLILNVEGKSRLGAKRFSEIVRAADRLLKPGGLFVCADYGHMADMAKMSNQLEGSGLKMLQKEDLSVNILQVFKIEKRTKHSLTSLSIYGWIRHIFSKIHSKERAQLEAELNGEASVYLAFLLKKD